MDKQNNNTWKVKSLKLEVVIFLWNNTLFEVTELISSGSRKESSWTPFATKLLLQAQGSDCH